MASLAIGSTEMTPCAYLGPAGTFAHQAAIDLAGPSAELVAESDVESVIGGISAGRYVSGIVPFENSQEGEVGASLDIIASLGGEPVLVAERVLPVTFTLFRWPGDDVPLTEVSSHPFALAQCSRYSATNGLTEIPAASTARACQELASSRTPGRGAIGAPNAGGVYGLEAVAAGIETHGGALTRFVKLGAHCEGPTIRDRTAFVVRPEMDQPGGLMRILQQFSLRSINLTAITSRPARNRLGNYWFYLECEGHILQNDIKEAVMNILLDGGDITFLGSFPEDPSRPVASVPTDSAAAYRRYSAMRGRVADADA